ncbi:MAG: dihydropteroate synthase [Bacteroidales bacterium]|nr:dihydropteroate synthase [Bacteroidales bacterium]
MFGDSERNTNFIRVNGMLMDLSVPRVMGVLNITPDSFYDGCRSMDPDNIVRRADTILSEGADMIDLGAYSSRPGADDVSEEEEIVRLRSAFEVLKVRYPSALFSIDTFRSKVAEVCVKEYQASIINDISGGEIDSQMFETVAKLQVPYILTHIQGTPQSMQKAPKYENLRREVLQFFSNKVKQLRDLKVNDIILDPGFGFGKSLQHNYHMMAHLDDFEIFNLPLLVGVSRKSMIYKLLDTDPQGSLNGTTVLNTVSLLKGANIIRVHDVREAVEAVRIVSELRKNI